MPIFFNLESHFWVFTLFLLNGLFATWLFRDYSSGFAKITESFEAQALSAFFCSLAINSLVLSGLYVLGLSFSSAHIPLIIISLAMLVWVLCLLRRGSHLRLLSVEFDFSRAALYAVVFILLFYNGAFIEQVSDAWWHMSLANKIGLTSTFHPEPGHLIGLPTRYYPPLWHANLAMAHQVSGIAYPTLWNSLTAWVAVFKVMAVYLFAFGFTKQRSIAFLSALLFVLLPGVGTSYMRVSAWPSHIAYTAWFCLFYLTSNILDQLSDRPIGLARLIRNTVKKSTSILVCFIVLGLIIFFTHQAEVLWFAVACFAYCIAASLSRNLSTKTAYLADRDHALIKLVYRLILLCSIVYFAYSAISFTYPSWGFSDQVISKSLPVVMLLILAAIEFLIVGVAFKRILGLSLVILILVSLNFTHFLSLFVPELSLPKGSLHKASTVALGYFGGELRLPTLQLQLRGGLLYSGVFGVFMSVLLVMIKPNRASLLLSGTSVVALVFCMSPYLYDWLQSILSYHSPWRVSIIIFHPVTWAIVLVSLFKATRINNEV